VVPKHQQFAGHLRVMMLSVEDHENVIVVPSFQVGTILLSGGMSVTLYIKIAITKSPLAISKRYIRINKIEPTYQI
jgi:hypothetical protein